MMKDIGFIMPRPTIKRRIINETYDSVGLKALRIIAGDIWRNTDHHHSIKDHIKWRYNTW